MDTSADGSLHDRRFPGEDEAYRSARDRLLAAELELRAKMEEVAALRRSLPLGGALKEDYELTEEREGRTVRTRLSELFAPGKDSLVLYGFMYSEEMERPCPMCSCFLDGLDAYAPHIEQRTNLAVVAESPASRLRDLAAERGWRNLRLLSSGAGTYGADYHAELEDGRQMPMCNVFARRDDAIHHTWGSEVLYAPSSSEQDSRHIDLIWPVWSVLDLTPEGRGDWRPGLSYDGE